jgi:hypothetical protein
MKHSFHLVMLSGFLLALGFARPAVAQHEHGASEVSKLGTVSFPPSCSAPQTDFNRAVALLHSFWYKKAEESFAAIAKADPSCGMAEWGRRDVSLSPAVGRAHSFRFADWLCGR